MKKKGKLKMIIIIIAIVLAVFTAQGLLLAGFNYAGPFKGLAVSSIQSKYNANERSGEIVFYGASNFTRWSSMEEDISMYKVQNHGFGGSDDEALMYYADRALYPYNPKIIVFQTGSNDYVAETGTDEEKITKCMNRKLTMFSAFHEKLPDAKMIVLSGLLLPGRSQYLEMTLTINDRLEELCGRYSYLEYVNAEALTYNGHEFDESKFVSDGIHLTDDARVVWANDYIIPKLNEVVSSLGAGGDSLRK